MEIGWLCQALPNIYLCLCTDTNPVLTWQLMLEQSADAVSFNEADGITSLSHPKWSESLIKAFSLVKKRTSCPAASPLCVGEGRVNERREGVFNISLCRNTHRRKEFQLTFIMAKLCNFHTVILHRRDSIRPLTLRGYHIHCRSPVYVCVGAELWGCKWRTYLLITRKSAIVAGRPVCIKE